MKKSPTPLRLLARQLAVVQAEARTLGTFVDDRELLAFKDTPQPCSFASYLIRVRFGNGCLPDFVSYFINSVFGRAWIADVVSQQVGQANVNGTKLQALAIPLPPFAEQTRIVAEVERRLSVVEELESVVPNYIFPWSMILTCM
jgi:restriction endonuclease S subunit